MIFKNLFRRKKTEESTDNLIIIVGLGNPGAKYVDSRHNAGFLAADHLRETWGFEDFHVDKKFNASLSKGSVGKSRVLLVKPETFMNDSGQAVRLLLDYYRVDRDRLVVIHDDIDIKSGELKVSLGSGSAGHNGVESIIEALGSKEFRRIRLGIGRPTESQGLCIPIHDYVLGKFSPNERVALHALFPRLQEFLEKDKTPE